MTKRNKKISELILDLIPRINLSGTLLETHYSQSIDVKVESTHQDPRPWIIDLVLPRNTTLV